MRFKVRNNGIGLCSVRDKQNMVSFQMTNYREDPKLSYNVGDAITIVAHVHFQDNGILTLHGNFLDIQKVENSNNDYLSLPTATPPGKVS